MVEGVNQSQLLAIWPDSPHFLTFRHVVLSPLIDYLGFLLFLDKGLLNMYLLFPHDQNTLKFRCFSSPP
jgi:hypothetical protein